MGCVREKFSYIFEIISEIYQRLLEDWRYEYERVRKKKKFAKQNRERTTNCNIVSVMAVPAVLQSSFLETEGQESLMSEFKSRPSSGDYTVEKSG